MAAEPAHSAGTSAGASVPHGTWPHALSHVPSLRVGDVLAALAGEFPSLSPSKLRFLDKQGLVSPERTHAGYRQYSQADVERLRYVLRTQRDGFVPLQVIGQRLADLDAGLSHAPVAMSAVSAETMGVDDFARASGTTPATIASLVEAGVLTQAGPGEQVASELTLARAAAEYLESGADVREARALARVVERERQAARSAAAPLRRTDDDSVAAVAQARRLEAAAALFQALANTQPADGRATPSQ